MNKATSNTDAITSTDRTALGPQPDQTPVAPPPPSLPLPANPAAAVGLTAVNGVAATFLRSDGAPALSQAITPTWSQKHIFQVPPALPSYVVGSLPAAPGAGARAMVTDALAPAFGAAVAAGGAAIVPVYYTGAAWFVG